MNDSTLIQLKVLVERVVRPIRASLSRKHRMRDELLAHVISTFEQEFEKLGDESTALNQTAIRFGDQTDLTRQLQQSVSAMDRARLFIDGMWSRPGEAWIIRAIRQAVIIVISLIGFMAIPLFIARADLSKLPIEAIRIVEPTLIAMLLIAISYPFFVEWMFRALYGSKEKSWLWIGMVSLVCGAILVALALILGSSDAQSLMMSAFFGAVWIPISLACMAQAAVMRIRHEQEWEALFI